MVSRQTINRRFEHRNSPAYFSYTSDKECKTAFFLNRIHFSSFLLLVIGQILRNKLETERDLILETDSDEAISAESESGPDGDTMVAGINNKNASHIISGFLAQPILPLELSVD